MFENLNYGYEVIDPIIGLDYDPNYFVDFSQKDTLRLNKIGFENIRLKENYNHSWDDRIYINSEETIFLMKKVDEWYYVRDMSRRKTTWYKCDQFGGLLSCLRNECGMYYKTLGMNESVGLESGGWQEISGYEYEYNGYKNDTKALALTYTDKEFNKINSIIPTKNLINDVKLLNHEEEGVSVYFNIILDGDIDHILHYRKVWIFKLDDEWYLVKVFDAKRKGRCDFIYYKCDQFYGLKNLIKDEIFKDV